MNKYIAFFKGKKIEVVASDSYSAQLEASKQFKAKKSYEVTVILSELNGKSIVHVLEN